MSTNVQNVIQKTNKTDNNRFNTVSETDNSRFNTVSTPFPPPLPSSESSSLGKVTSYYAKSAKKPINKGNKPTESELSKLKYDYKKVNVQRKKKIGKKIDRVAGCGVRLIDKNRDYINVVQGDKGGIYYSGMQRCGCVWFCPDCMYKMMKSRASELYDQLKVYNGQGKTVLFVTFTVQHKYNDKLKDLHETLLGAFKFANSHRKWVEAKKNVPVEYLRALEVLKGSNGWHPHLHSVFIGSAEVVDSINIFKGLYEQYLVKKGLLVNEHTVGIDKWNGKLDSLKDYVFKGMIEHEITGGNLRKSGKGKNFFELIDDDNKPAIAEYIKVMKGKRQYHRSKNFFKDVDVKSDEDVLKDDVTAIIFYQIPKPVFEDMRGKGIALHFLNEYAYGGQERAMKLMDLYDCDTGFMGDKSKHYG